jgi:hypothetical protein
MKEPAERAAADFSANSFMRAINEEQSSSKVGFEPSNYCPKDGTNKCAGCDVRSTITGFELYKLGFREINTPTSFVP